MRFVNDILLSAPSIVVIGLFIYAAVVGGALQGLLGWPVCWPWRLIVIPVVIRTTENMLSLVPNGCARPPMRLGTPKVEGHPPVTLKARRGRHHRRPAGPGAHRGETAPLLFTAPVQPVLDHVDLSEPMASLPVTIFQFAMSPYENWQKLAWAGVFLITIGVLMLNILARVLFEEQTLIPLHGRQSRTSHVAERAPRSRCKQPQLLLRQLPRPEEHQPGHPGEEGDRLHRPVGLRQEHAFCARFNRMFELYPSSARRRDPAGRREHPLVQQATTFR